MHCHFGVPSQQAANASVSYITHEAVRLAQPVAETHHGRRTPGADVHERWPMWALQPRSQSCSVFPLFKKTHAQRCLPEGESSPRRK